MEKAGVSIPAFTADPNEAQTWVDKGGVVVVRQLLCASEGKGISVIEKGGQVPRHAPLYTRYIPKFDEYRVHVWDGQVIDIQQKKLRRGDDEREADTRIRNAKFGWVFCREAVECPEVVTQEAIKAAKALGLDFGAIDIGHTRNRNRATVYEANTAPGLEGTTLERYSARIRRAGGACRG
jgi:glutathione synthase/RimK-type ligase-like ATP-grasp enzyme